MRVWVSIGIAAGALWLGAQTEERVHAVYQEVMIPMRDGVRLQTVILTPASAREVGGVAKGPLPFLIQRTPYGVPARDTAEKGFPATQRWSLENYIVVTQNIRGR